MLHELAATALDVSVLCPGLVSTNIVNSERNRPGADTDDADSPTYAMRGETLPPDVVADEVVNAVRSNRFWVLPHSHYADQAVDLAIGRRDGQPPAHPIVRIE